MKNKDDAQALEKLMHLTKLLKKDNVKVAPKGPPKPENKWRREDPKFAPKTEKPRDVVQAGGMEVDPSLREEYEQWRQDKIEEQNYRRASAQRKAKAGGKESVSQTPPPQT